MYRVYPKYIVSCHCHTDSVRISQHLISIYPTNTSVLFLCILFPNDVVNFTTIWGIIALLANSLLHLFIFPPAEFLWFNIVSSWWYNIVLFEDTFFTFEILGFFFFGTKCWADSFKDVILHLFTVHRFILRDHLFIIFSVQIFLFFSPSYNLLRFSSLT